MSGLLTFVLGADLGVIGATAALTAAFKLEHRRARRTAADTRKSSTPHLVAQR
jgi:hypothetical protein